MISSSKKHCLLFSVLTILALLTAEDVFAQLPANIVDSTNAFQVGIGPDGTLFNAGLGFQRVADAYDPLAPGTARDSWGVSAGATAGWVDPEYGAFGSGVNLVNNGSTSTAHSATASSFLNAGAGNLLQIDQSFSFAAPNVLRIAETITNLSGVTQAVNFARDVDWDMNPLPIFNSEVSTAPAVPFGLVTAATFDGFEHPSPLVAYTKSPVPAAGGVAGPADLGGGMQLSLGTLGAGESTTFFMLYALSQSGQLAPDLASQLIGLGAQYVITTQSSESFPGLGINSAAIGVSAVPEPSSLVLIGLGTLGLFVVARRRRKA